MKATAVAPIDKTEMREAANTNFQLIRRNDMTPASSAIA